MLNYCKDFAWQDLIEIHPEKVFLMGNTPLSAILGENGISNWNGVAVRNKFDYHEGLDDITFYPLYHPAYILRDPSKTDEWLAAIAKAVDDTGETREVEYPIQLFYPMTLDALADMRTYLDDFEWISYDTETHHQGNALDAFGNDSVILSISLAGGEAAYAVPIYHPEAPWKDDQELEWAISIVQDILKSHAGKIIGHNLKFDSIWTKQIFDYWLQSGGDTMLLNHLLDSQPGEHHGLKRLAGVYLDMYNYEEELFDFVRAHPEANAKKGGTYAKVPWEILKHYGALDAKATLLLHDVLYPKLSEEQQYLYNELIIPATDALAEMQYNGLTLDKKIATRYTAIYTLEKQRAFKGLLSDPKVKHLMRDHQKSLKKGEFIFNPASTRQLCELYFEYYGATPVYKKDKVSGLFKKTPTTESDSYKNQEGKFPIFKQIRYWKLFQKMLSTYLRPASTGAWLSDDGKVHTNFNQAGSVTGRLASSEPVNLQNIPAPDKEPGTLLEVMPIKNVFINSDWIDLQGNDVQPGELNDDEWDYGGLIVADYAGMELRVFASIAKCEPMLAIHRSGLDFHKMVAALCLGKLNRDDIEHAVENKDEINTKVLNGITKEVRRVYKSANFALLYGGSDYTLTTQYDVPPEDAKQVLKTYYAVFPELQQYQDDMVEQTIANGYVESAFGRREYLPDINSRDEKRFNRAKREAINMPIQSTASDVLLIAMVILQRELKRRAMHSKLCNEVHDSLMGDCPREEFVPFAMLCQDVMANVKAYAAIEMPHVRFDWLICPLRADVEIGTHYGSTINFFDEWIKEFAHEYDQTKATYHRFGITNEEPAF